MRGRRVWFETVMTTGPAPAFEGDKVTLSLWMTPLRADRDRRPRVVPEVLVAAARHEAADRDPASAPALLDPTAENLPEPDRPARQQEVELLPGCAGSESR